MSRDLITRRLTHEGYEVDAVETAASGIETTRRELPDLVLMDLSLPDIDGWTATEKLKENPDTRSIPIIAITAHATKNERDKALEAGCEEYESKPVNFDKLQEKIETLLNEKS